LRIKKFSAILAVITISTMLFSNIVSAKTISNTLKVTYNVSQSANAIFTGFKTKFLADIKGVGSKESMDGVLKRQVNELESFDVAVKHLITNDIIESNESITKPDLFKIVIPNYLKLNDARKLGVANAVFAAKDTGYYNILDVFAKHVKISTDTALMIESFNGDSVTGVKIAIENFNEAISKLRTDSIDDFNALQVAIDTYFNGNNVAINLISLINDYNELSPDEQLAVAAKIYNSRQVLDDNKFHDFYEGTHAFLPYYANAVTILKNLGNLINLTWNDGSATDKTYTVAENEAVTLTFKAKATDKDLTVTGVKYIMTCTDILNNTFVGTDVIEGMINGVKEVAGTYDVTGEETTHTVTFIFKTAGNYSITIHAEK
jgi:hypothetical protein